jgi:acetylornithine deacetylase/succinyl-diaminopimelate desuccinylase-like protein
MDTTALKEYIDHVWEQSIIPSLIEYIHIPNKSPLFDPDWHANGHMQKAVDLIAGWCKQQKIPGMKLEVVTLPGRTPVILIEIPGASDDTVLLYGHLDKQPEMSGWDADLAPWKAALRGDHLYGRGGADDGYAAFASLTAIKALHEQQIPHARCVILIESCEESGSYDLPFYIDALEPRIGNPGLVICLDSGCGNYDQLWMTTSLRGLVSGNLHIDVLQHGIHSGMGSGIIPSSMMIARQLLERLENRSDGVVPLAALQVEIPDQRKQQATQAAEILKNELLASLPFEEGVKPLNDDLAELILNRTWRAALSVTGADGLPALANAGNVTLPQLTLKISMRVPPTCDAEQAAKAVKACLEDAPPFNAKIQFDLDTHAVGWNAPAESPWLLAAAKQASMNQFGRDAAFWGEGGSIPFMGMLGKKYPQAQFVITGVLGPKSNAHGPNEFLHIPTGKKLTACVAEIIALHHQHGKA